MDSHTTNEDQAVLIDVLANDTDPAGSLDLVELIGATNGLHGTVLILDNGTPAILTDDRVQYTPDADYSGFDVFEYEISDGDGGTSMALVEVEITAVNDPAVVSSADVGLNETDAPVSTVGTLTSTDVDNPDHTFTPSNTAGVIGSFAIDVAGFWTFTANSPFDSLNVGDNVNETYNVTSVDGTPSTVKITIEGTNDLIMIDLNGDNGVGIDYANTFIEDLGPVPDHGRRCDPARYRCDRRPYRCDPSRQPHRLGIPNQHLHIG